MDSATTHFILRDACFFESIKLYDSDVHTISGKSKLIEGFATAQIEFPNRTRLTIEDALYAYVLREGRINRDEKVNQGREHRGEGKKELTLMLHRDLL